MPEARVRAATPWFIRYVLNPIFVRTGSFPILAVRGRRSGQVRRTPVNVVEIEGVHYLISPRGETGWSRNLRVVGECSLKMSGREARFQATEVPPAERQPVIAAYVARWKSQTGGYFEKLPDPIDHPTFRLEPIG
jgi:deazaflavin-dependent oxidoreductase (nitroreductase family)